MVISGTLNKNQASVETVAELTLNCLHKCVPHDVPGIVFLSGGQSNELATEHLNEMNKKSKHLPWNLSFSYGRALQQSALKFWAKNIQNVKGTQEVFNQRAKMCSLASKGKWSEDLEKI